MGRPLHNNIISGVYKKLLLNGNKLQLKLHEAFCTMHTNKKKPGYTVHRFHTMGILRYLGQGLLVVDVSRIGFELNNINCFFGKMILSNALCASISRVNIKKKNRIYRRFFSLLV